SNSVDGPVSQVLRMPSWKLVFAVPQTPANAVGTATSATATAAHAAARATPARRTLDIFDLPWSERRYPVRRWEELNRSAAVLVERVPPIVVDERQAQVELGEAARVHDDPMGPVVAHDVEVPGAEEAQRLLPPLVREVVGRVGDVRRRPGVHVHGRV